MLERPSIYWPKRAVHLVGDISSNGYFSHGIKPSVLSSANMGNYYFSLVGLIAPSAFIKSFSDTFLLSSILVLVDIDLNTILLCRAALANL